MKEYIILSGDVISIGNVTANIPSSKILTSVKEAQIFDIKPAIGDALYIALMQDSVTATTLNNLFTGCTYSYDDGTTTTTYMHEGIKEATKYYAYARFLSTNQIQATQFGVVNKAADESQQVSKAELIWQINQNTEKGSGIMKDVLLFIERNPTDFATYLNSNKRTTRGIRIKSIGS